jgi:hypothetical protein
VKSKGNTVFYALKVKAENPAEVTDAGVGTGFLDEMMIIGYQLYHQL